MNARYTTQTVEYHKCNPFVFTNKINNVYFEDTIAKAILYRAAEKVYGVKPRAIGDMRYITVPYTITLLNCLTNNQLDLYRIWKGQEISQSLKHFYT